MTAMRKILRPLLVLVGLCLAWQAVVTLTGLPRYILPGPLAVGQVLAARFDFLLFQAAVTVAEILIGMAIGTLLGIATALALAEIAPVRRWLLPLLVVSQAIPVFALAPLLVIWLGYGMASKIAAASLVIFFPVTSAFLDGLRRTDRSLLDLAQVMGASRWRQLVHLRVPAALPAFASGLRVAAAVAPIGAVIGEWVGAGAGLGFVMLQANARMQIDLVFAALALLALSGVALYYAVDRVLRWLIPWLPVTAGAEPDPA